MSTEPTVCKNPQVSQAKSNAIGVALAGKYMTFKLSNEVYGVEILKVRELIEMQDITQVPRTQEFIRGVINLRGKVHPVLDLRLKLGMERTESRDQTVIIVVQYEHQGETLVMGVLVDEVLEVLSIESSQIEPPPNFVSGDSSTEFILGIGKNENRVIFLLDIGKVLTARETAQIAETN